MFGAKKITRSRREGPQTPQSQALERPLAECAVPLPIAPAVIDCEYLRRPVDQFWLRSERNRVKINHSALSGVAEPAICQGGEIGRRARLRIWWRNP